MNGFIMLCLVAATTANQLGYNYQQTGPSTAIGGDDFGNASGNEDEQQGGIDIRFGGGIGDNQGSSNAHGSGFSGFDNPINSNGNGNGNANSNGFNTIASLNQHPSSNVEFNKEIYKYSAPEDEDLSDYEIEKELSGPVKKKLRVIFIRSPENQAFTNAALQLAKQSIERHTVVYVLTKQTDIGALTNQLKTIRNSHTHKPEVHFVKYRTPEEAERAQQVIRAQYDSLRGTSHSSNEGVAPVLNFALPSSATAIGGFSGIGNNGISLGESSRNNAGAGGVGGTEYLPPVFQRL